MTDALHASNEPHAPHEPHTPNEPEPRGRAAVVVVSTQAAGDVALDTTGPVIVAWLRDRGFTLDSAVVVADGGPIADIVAAELAGGARVVITTGGTGVTPTDRTPEAVRPFIDLELPGIIEELRRRGADVGVRSLLTRGVAGLTSTASGRTGGVPGLGAGGAFLVTLPGSLGGVQDGLDIIDGLLDHVLAQVGGEGHAPRGQHQPRGQHPPDGQHQPRGQHAGPSA